MDSEVSLSSGIVFRVFASAISWSAVWAAPSISRGHAVEQIFVEFEQAGRAWEAEVLFDAAFALPEFRADTDEPPPEREWLVGLPAEEHARIRDGATEYLRERLRFRLGEVELAWDIAFPDYEQTPPDFPKLLNGGAYTRVRLSGVLPAREGGEVSLQLADGSGPTVVVAVDPEGQPRYVTVPPEEKVSLLDIDVGSGRGWRSIMVGIDSWPFPALFAGAVVVVLLLIKLKTRSRGQ